VTAEEVKAELERMRGLLDAQQAEIAALKARPESPHARAIADFEAEHQRRYEAGLKMKAEQLAAEERKLDEICATRSWVKVTCNPRLKTVEWREIVEEAGPSEFKPVYVRDTTLPLQPTGEWVSTTQSRVMTMSMAGGGYELAIATEWARRVLNNPELARLVANGTFAVEPLSAEENRTHERQMLLQGERNQVLALSGMKGA